MFASFWLAKMTTGLAVLSFVGALSIDNQLTPLVSDCFERLAIGERLNQDKVYKTFKYNTVADCKKACSEQKNSCKAFAFGISAKGNATCELSINAIKETAELKPIGSVADTDFDLYIKKLDCTLVIDKSSHPKPSEQNYQPSPKPVTLGNIRPQDEIFFKPLQNTFDEHELPDKPPHTPDLSHHYLHVSDKNPYGETKPNQPPHPPDLSHHYRPSPNKDGIHNVHTLVSVASGPQTVLNPVHGILVAGDSSGGYGGQHADKLPPFRPEALDFPYDDHKNRPRPDDFDRPNQDYGIRPVHESSGEYGHGGSFQRPLSPVERPDLDRYDILKPESTEYYSDRYGDRPSRIPFRPHSSYFDSDRPLPDKYGSLIPHPDAYNKRPPAQGEYLFEHEHQHQEYHSEYFHQSVEDDPNYHYHRPSRPIQDYDDRRRPQGGNGIHGEDHHKPDYHDERPLVDDHYDRPVALAQTYDGGRPRPRPSHTYRPHQDERPLKPHPDGYGFTTKPNGIYDDEKHTRPLSKPLEGYGGESTRPDTYRPSVDRPYADSGPYVDRPNSNKPYDDSNPNNSILYEGSRPSVNRPHSTRPYDSGQTISRPYEDSRPHSSRPYDDSRPDSYKPPEDSRPHSNRPYDDSSPHNDRPFDVSRPHSNRPYADSRPHNRPFDDSRPQNDRPYDDSRPHSNIPYDDSRPHSNRPYDDSRPNRPFDDSRPQNDRPYDDSRPHSNILYDDSRPHSNRPFEDSRPHNNRPFEDPRPYEDEKPNRPKPIGNGISAYLGGDDRNSPGGDKNSRPIVTHSTGSNGEEITSIITEIADACFRRVLAGKRVSQIFVKRGLTCETVEECQRECADEKRFSCEGFNYRLDPSGRGKGECELINQPLSRLDIGRDLYPDPDYDYYERDRNAAPLNCNRWPSGNRYGGHGGYSGGGSYHHGYGGGYDHGHRGGGGGSDYYADRRYDYEAPRRPPPDYGPPVLRRPGDRWSDDDRYNRRPPRPDNDYDQRKPQIPYDRDYRPGGNRRGDFSHSHHTQDHFHQTDRIDDRRFYVTRPHKPDPYEPYSPPRYHEHQKNKFWDTPRYGGSSRPPEGNRRNYYLPPTTESTKDWGQYGGTGGTFGNEYHLYGDKHSYNYWGLGKYGDKYGGTTANGIEGSYLPLPKPQIGGFLPVVPKPQGSEGYLVPKPVGLGSGSYLPVLDNSILPLEPRRPPSYNFIKDECSLRSASGFRLHKGIVKKFYAVPNIYECELLCFREKDFPCTSYAFRYTVTLSTPTDNCYLSNRNYKELDFYTDLEPDRDFDIYTMNNKNSCEEPIVQGRDHSDCFWRVRSGQRLDYKVVRDSLTVKSIVDCQIECLKSTRFTCRAFSYRYGSPIIGGSIDNCQLTDWPFYELDPRIHFIPEPGFEVYDRGSFGHGCEPDHFGIRGQISKDKHGISKADQLCYIGFGSPARLLPQATKKSLYVLSELACKEECSIARQTTLFQCMSFSFRTSSDKNLPNCYLSDIYQRDLLINMDYVYDPDFWLFAWDNFNPECVALASEPRDNHIGGEIIDRNEFLHGLDTWRLYSVSGWPCKKGALCQQNRETGFWFCELEGGAKGAWDYCCRPEHQCGASHGYQYQWCYVGPTRTQWRKCSDRYFPYIHNVIDRIDHIKPYLPDSQKPWVPPPPPVRPGGRPDRPPAPPRQPPPRPSLNQYEMIFDEEFLEPPKPGGFGQPRHWPVSYLHKEMPPNTTDSRIMRMEEENPKYAAIQNLINVIKSNDLNNIQYHISNESNKADDILFVKIPLPTNFTRNVISSNSSVNFQKDDNISKRSGKFVQGVPRWSDVEKSTESTEESGRSSKPIPAYTEATEGSEKSSKPIPVYRRAFVTRTNVTKHGSYS